MSLFQIPIQIIQEIGCQYIFYYNPNNEEYMAPLIKYTTYQHKNRFTGESRPRRKEPSTSTYASHKINSQVGAIIYYNRIRLVSKFFARIFNATELIKLCIKKDIIAPFAFNLTKTIPALFYAHQFKYHIFIVSLEDRCEINFHLSKIIQIENIKHLWIAGGYLIRQLLSSKQRQQIYSWKNSDVDLFIHTSDFNNCKKTAETICSILDGTMVNSKCNNTIYDIEIVHECHTLILLDNRIIVQLIFLDYKNTRNTRLDLPAGFDISLVQIGIHYIPNQNWISGHLALSPLSFYSLQTGEIFSMISSPTKETEQRLEKYKNRGFTPIYSQIGPNFKINNPKWSHYAKE